MKKIFKYILIGILVIIGLFSIWFRFFLSEHDEFKNSTIFEHYKNISTDGPYVLYKNDSLRVINVNEKERNDYELTDVVIPKNEEVFIVNTFCYNNSEPISFKLH